MSVLHAAQYYGIPRLAHLCEVTLAKMLRVKGAPTDGGQLIIPALHLVLLKEASCQPRLSCRCCFLTGIADCSAALLALADDHGLPHLLCVALDFCVANFEEVSKTGAAAGHGCGIQFACCSLHDP